MVRTIIAIVASQNWSLHQMNVNSMVISKKMFIWNLHLVCFHHLHQIFASWSTTRTDSWLISNLQQQSWYSYIFLGVESSLWFFRCVLKPTQIYISPWWRSSTSWSFVSTINWEPKLCYYYLIWYIFCSSTSQSISVVSPSSIFGGYL